MDERSAQDKVCTIPELVEAILLQANLPPLDLLLTRRTNKTFNNVILNASPFRQTLFLDTKNTSSSKDLLAVDLNPFLEKMLPKAAKSYFDLMLGRRAYGRLRGVVDSERRLVDEERDFLVSEGNICKRCYSNRMDLASLPDDECYLHLPLLETYDEEDYFSPEQWYEHALWRKMYATRPVLPVHVVDTTPIAHRWEIAPTTMGEIVDSLVVGKVVFLTPEERAKEDERKRRTKEVKAQQSSFFEGLG